jgi:predicted  nucleic acid-binding Zn-ribbon protein
MKQDVAAARASNKEAQSEAARLRTELGEALRQLADRETAMEWMEVEQEKELSALRRQAAAAAATVEAQTREIAELKAAQEAAWSEAALASAKAEAAEAAATAATVSFLIESAGFRVPIRSMT